MSRFTRYLQRLVKFWQGRKKWEVNFASKLREQCGFIILFELRRPGKKCTWSFNGRILGYELSFCMRNGRKEKYLDLDSLKNKKNKMSSNKKASSITFHYFVSFLND